MVSQPRSTLTYSLPCELQISQSDGLFTSLDIFLISQCFTSSLDQDNGIILFHELQVFWHLYVKEVNIVFSSNYCNNIVVMLRLQCAEKFILQLKH
jgi:hypothetical protein